MFLIPEAHEGPIFKFNVLSGQQSETQSQSHKQPIITFMKVKCLVFLQENN